MNGYNGLWSGFYFQSVLSFFQKYKYKYENCGGFFLMFFVCENDDLEIKIFSF